MMIIIPLFVLVAGIPNGIAHAGGSSLRGVSPEVVPSEQHHRKLDDATDDAAPPIADVSINWCFSAKSTVEVEGQGLVLMKDLQVGDKVLTRSTDTTNDEYELVYAFAHRHEKVSTEFLQIFTTDTGNPLEVTGQHLIYKFGNNNPVRADSIQVGDELQAVKGDDNDRKVTKIRTVTREGVFAPVTPKGTIVVDGIVASNYISLQDDADEYIQLKGGIQTFLSQHQYIHFGLSPFRLICMHGSGSFAAFFCEPKEDKDGLPLMVSFGLDLHDFGNRHNIFVQVLVMLATQLLAFVCMIVDYTFGAHWNLSCVTTWVGCLMLVKTVTMDKIKID